MALIILVRYRDGESYREENYPQEDYEWIIDKNGGVTIHKKVDGIQPYIAYYPPHNLIFVKEYNC
jgi:hypothetical protein